MTRFDDDEKDAIVKRYKTGETILAISITLDCSQTTVRRVLLDRGIARRGRARVGKPHRLGVRSLGAA